MKTLFLLICLFISVTLLSNSKANLLLPESVYILMPLDSFLAKTKLYDSVKYLQVGEHSHALAQKYSDLYLDTSIESTKCSFFFSDGKLTQVLVSFRVGTSAVIKEIFEKNVRKKCLESASDNSSFRCISYNGRTRNTYYGLSMEPFVALTIRHKLHNKIGLAITRWNNFSSYKRESLLLTATFKFSNSTVSNPVKLIPIFHALHKSSNFKHSSFGVRLQYDYRSIFNEKQVV
jgi:hypothetical protein